MISDGLGHPITHSKGLNTIFVNFDSIPLVKLWQNLGEKLKNIYILNLILKPVTYLMAVRLTSERCKISYVTK